MKTLSAILVALALSTPANAAPIFATEHEGTRIVLFDEPCALDAVTNLQRRATWTEAGKTFEGCFAVFGGRVVVAYFADRTVAAIPVPVFVPVKGT